MERRGASAVPSRVVTDHEHSACGAALHAPAEAADCEQRLKAVLAAEAGVRWAYLFGSSARGKAFRDLDVGVMLGASARGGVALGRLANRIHEAARGLPVDVVDLGSAAPALLGRVVREGRLLADREPDARKDWEVEANSRALDLAPWLAEFERLRNEALRRKGRAW